MMAHKLKVTNPQDYGLYKLVDGHGKLKLFYSMCKENESPPCSLVQLHVQLLSFKDQKHGEIVGGHWKKC